MHTATAATSVSTPAPEITEQPDYAGALNTALSMFGESATDDRSMVRAHCFIACLAGAVRGAGDATLGAAIFAVVQPPQPSAAGAA